MNEQIAWAAGILEGEGCFSKHKRSNRPNTMLCAIHCEMSDEDVVRKLHGVFQVGSVILRPNMNNRTDRRERKQTWIWSVQNKAGIKTVLEAILPYMGQRRSEKIKEILEGLS